MKEVNFDKISNLSRQDRYSEVLKAVESLTEGEPNLTANLSNIASLLKDRKSVV